MENQELILEIVKITSPLIVSIFAIYWSHRLMEKRKIFLDLFERRFIALEEVYMAMCECFHVLNKYGNVPPKTLEEFNQNVAKIVDKWEQIEQKYALWLTSIKDEIDRVRRAFRSVKFAIWLKLPASEIKVDPQSYSDKIRQINWKEFSEAFENAIEAIKRTSMISFIESELKSYIKKKSPLNSTII